MAHDTYATPNGSMHIEITSEEVKAKYDRDIGLLDLEKKLIIDHLTQKYLDKLNTQILSSKEYDERIDLIRKDLEYVKTQLYNTNEIKEIFKYYQRDLVF